MIKYFVIKIVNVSGAGEGVWFKDKDGYMFICRVSGTGSGYITNDYIDEYCSQGLIEPSFAKIMATFEDSDIY